MKKILLVLSFLLSFGLALPQVKIDIRNLRAKPKTDDICLNEQIDHLLLSSSLLSGFSKLNKKQSNLKPGGLYNVLRGAFSI